MGHKAVCIPCRVSFSQGNDAESHISDKCPQCGGSMILLSQKFKPPKKKDDEKWEVVALLIEKGFHYSSAYRKLEDNLFVRADYPEKLRDVEDFVKNCTESIYS